MEQLNLPAYAFTTQTVAGKAMIYDTLRSRYVRLTPEEWVRQHFIRYLIEACAVPPGLVAVEASFTYQRMARRADVIVHDRQGQPWMMVECKAPHVALGQAVFDQVARYNTVIDAPYLVVTNGLEHFACAIDRAAHTYHFLDALPVFEEG